MYHLALISSQVKKNLEVAKWPYKTMAGLSLNCSVLGQKASTNYKRLMSGRPTQLFTYTYALSYQHYLYHACIRNPRTAISSWQMYWQHVELQNHSAVFSVTAFPSLLNIFCCYVPFLFWYGNGLEKDLKVDTGLLLLRLCEQLG